jgi:glutathione S-transferase
MFAALNTIEPPVTFLNQLQQMEVSLARALRKPVTAVVQRCLRSLADRLESRHYLEDEFSAADLLMTTVLRILRTTDLVRAVPALEAYQSRCEARAAFQRALSSQMTAFRNHEPGPV